MANNATLKGTHPTDSKAELVTVTQADIDEAKVVGHKTLPVLDSTV